MTLGNKIMELRKKQFLSQEDFAQIIGVSRQSISKWELDQTYPTMDKLIEISDYFQITLDELLRDKSANIEKQKPMDYEKQENTYKKVWFHQNIRVLYFLYCSVMSVIIMVFFGVQEYMAGFLVSQMLVWSTVIFNVYRYFLNKKKKLVENNFTKS